MARYIGPKTKISRRFGESLFGYDKSFEKKGHPPGQHGTSKRRKVVSEYGIQLKAKQKAKYTYGVLERQFRNLFEEASRKEGITGTILLQFLESRLDNIVYRMGLAPTRPAARQLVAHCHLLVNGEKCNIPSRRLKINDVIGIRAKSRELELITSSISQKGKRFSWIEWNDEKMEGRFIAIPNRDEIPENIEDQLIVELYSK
ncbi:MAG: 30S ribosomal protein S4 [Chitinophagales bacterium]